jgi:outer membrane autotransporter protein
MARKKNLERAIILGLILSTGVYGSAWAAEVTTGNFENAANVPIEGISVDENNYTVSKDTTINGNTTGSALNWSWLGNKVITVENNANLTFNGIQLNNSTIKGNGNVTVENDNGGLAVFVGSNIQANTLTLNTTNGNGIYLYEHDLTLDVEHLVINCTQNGIIQEVSEGDIPLTKPVTVTIDDTQSININSSGYWALRNNAQSGVINNVYMRSDKEGSIINLMAANGVSLTSAGETILKADSINIGAFEYYGVYAGSGGTLDITAKNDVFIGDKINDENTKGDYARDAARAQNGTLVITAQNGNIKLIGESGVHTVGSGTATITAAQFNRILAADNTLHATGGDILITGQNNVIGADDDVLSSNFDFVYGDGKAISPENTSITTVKATGENGYNDVRGAVVVEKGASKVNITGTNNYVSSEYKQVTAADKDERNIVSAVYTKGAGASVTIGSIGDGINVIQSTAKDTDSEHTIWAQQGGNIEINGRTIVNAHNAGVNTDGVANAGNAYGVAVAAGTGDISGLTEIPDVENRSTVNLNYSGESQITGDIVSGYGGLINIGDNGLTRSNSNSNLVLQGNALAGNGGILNLNLGDGGVWYGRADDYGDAGSEISDGSHQSFYNPAFSNEILEGGSVNLTMGDGAKWYVQGQSWITNINTTGNALIDLTNVGDGYENYDSHALTVYNLNGGADIKMSLDGDRQFSDMLYIGNGTGTYNIELDKIVTVEDMYAEFGEGNKFSGLRFATVGKGSDVNFNVTASDKGFNNVIYTVGKDIYDSDVSSDENSSYNGDKMTLEKPGNSGVKDFLDGVESDSAAANKVLLLADENATGDELDNKNNHLNYKLIDMHTEYSDTGKAIIATSRANYSNAIYMDRLNKRLGEARYINSEEDEGMWVRIRHDRIGKDDAYRSQNTMYELGYDQKQECDNGERRVGMAIDYMHGDTGYNDIAGKGEIDRYGLWLYDTWMGDKGHYADYVAKWGHLSSEFDVYAPTSGEKISGDYCNNVLSISAEYGRKKDIGSDWYFEPQIQAQLARVTGADYTTSQGTKVNVDGINSLIGRAGFRLGKDFGEEKQSTVYIKADVLHEFLGDQDIRAFDTSTNGWQRISYENEGTWYDVGLGFAAMMSKSSYAFLDLERSFGHDNDETYQINVGMQWSF